MPTRLKRLSRLIDVDSIRSASSRTAFIRGIVETLEAFEAAGYAMCVVTAKPRVYALRILEHFAIAQLFRSVHGPELSARDYTKESLIREACVGAPQRISLTVMIGDSGEDVRGAKSNGIGSVAVTWGYGDREELEAAQPDRIVASSTELRDYIQSRRAGGHNA